MELLQGLYLNDIDDKNKRITVDVELLQGLYLNKWPMIVDRS